MTDVLKGKDVADNINQRLISQAASLRSKGINPAMAILRIGENSRNLTFEMGAEKRAATVGVEVRKYVLPKDIAQSKLVDLIRSLNLDRTVHGIMVLKPFPNHIDEKLVRNAIAPEKDIDGVTDKSLASIFAGNDGGYVSSTAQACMEMLEFYRVPMTDKRAVVIGRSVDVAKQVAMLLLRKNAIVTMCHTKAVNLEEICRESDILVVVAGRARSIGIGFFNENQTVLDAGTNANAAGMVYGDVDFSSAQGIVKAITPTPGGVGTVVSSVLLQHVIDSATKYGRPNAERIEIDEYIVS